MVTREVVLRVLKCNPAQYPVMLDEKFPHILEKIVDLWHSSEIDIYLADLLQPNGRSGGRMDRDGFPERAWDEIFALQQLYLKTRPAVLR